MEPLHGPAPGGSKRRRRRRRAALPAATPGHADLHHLDVPVLGHLSGPVVRTIGWMWLGLWITFFALDLEQLALPLMFLWIFASISYEDAVGKRRRAARKAARHGGRQGRPDAAPPAATAPPAADRAPAALGPSAANAVAAEGATAPPDRGTGALRALEAAVRRAQAAAPDLPPGAVATVLDIAATVRPLLARAAEPGADARVVHDLHALAGEYLPTALEDYLRLPPDVAAAPTATTGRTPAEELTEQLELLREGAAGLRSDLHAADAERLSTQRRFLETKFHRSDLDL
ncbi:hypothetical protein CLV92_106189 [Kineococcus xinjiangensis]|uniref:Uncharacterized protein n=1 Tax=Kineococcus xinjiangensis TaxID=512762 RepID=A0A2S6IMD1_9ACTN|nr:hypothetical protein [Kineococcus xinjiangensis]PPK95368.1 hypothetical protein CLV92_106189 [Kineococcus xinjiangensis]